MAYKIKSKKYFLGYKNEKGKVYIKKRLFFLGKSAKKNPLDNPEAMKVFILIKRGVNDTDNIARILKKKRPTIYDNVKSLKDFEIIESDRGKGFKIGKNAKKYEDLYKKEREKKIKKLNSELKNI